MRVALIFSESAGNGSYRREDLEGLFRLAGHRVRSYDNAGRAVRRAIRAQPDVLAVAGGDGTVARAATLVHKERSATKLYVLPTGTANNTARTLGVGCDIPGLVFALAHARAARFDVGVVKSPWMKRQRFIEAAGFGFIGRMLEQDGTARERLARARRTLTGVFGPRLTREERQVRGVARLIRAQQPIACRVRADGEDLDGEYIAVEALNIREVGPHVALAPQARPGDGWLDLLLVRPSDREALVAHVRARGASDRAPGIRRRVRKLRLTWPTACGHLDDECWPGDVHDGSDARVRIRVRRPIDLLLPPR